MINMKKKVVILEDHPIFTDGVLNILKDNSNIDITAQFKNIPDLIHHIYLQPVDIIIADIKIGTEMSLPYLLQYKKEHHTTGIILLSMFQPWEIQISSNDFPFESYVLKNSGSRVILQAVKNICCNKKYFDPNIQWEKNNEIPIKILLTKREKEIVELIKKGKTTREIAETLILSELTIKSHRQNMLKKFKAHNMVDLLMKLGLE
jgi:DNA-binding NarL/FixJ family response regulator